MFYSLFNSNWKLQGDDAFSMTFWLTNPFAIDFNDLLVMHTFLKFYGWNRNALILMQLYRTVNKSCLETVCVCVCVEQNGKIMIIFSAIDRLVFVVRTVYVYFYSQYHLSLPTQINQIDLSSNRCHNMNITQDGLLTLLTMLSQETKINIVCCICSFAFE